MTRLTIILSDEPLPADYPPVKGGRALCFDLEEVDARGYASREKLRESAVKGLANAIWNTLVPCWDRELIVHEAEVAKPEPGVSSTA